MMNRTSLPEMGIPGLLKHWREDALSGFLVFLIALPLSLGIAMASGLPPMAGILSAIVGGMFVSRINGSFVTINGPAAGLIVVILDAVQTLGEGDMMDGYRYALAAIVVSGILQIIMGRMKAGSISAFFPSSVVHGMLTAIGIIIMTKQVHVMLGVKPEPGGIFSTIAQVPHSLLNMNSEIALIGGLSLAVLVGWNRVTWPWLKRIPAPVVVVAIGIGLGRLFDLEHNHIFHVPEQLDMVSGHVIRDGEVGPSYLVAISEHFFSSFYWPDFGKFFTLPFWFAVISIGLVGSLETVLSALAVDKLDPYRRHSDPDKDLSAVGAGNMMSGLIGGSAMIAEIVRSSANINNGAKTGWANFFHAAFMLLFVVLFPQIIHSIPLAALAALLVFTGFRLASPSQFKHVYAIGSEQFLLFVVTIISVLATDLLVGVAIGIAVKLGVHILRGVWWNNLFKIHFKVTETRSGRYTIRLDGSAIFTNFLPLKKALDQLPKGQHLVLDFRNAYLIDHTVMEYLQDFMDAYRQAQGECIQLGDPVHRFSDHDLAARLMTDDERKQ